MGQVYTVYCLLICILRIQPEGLFWTHVCMYKAVKVIPHDRTSGDILMDVPEVDTVFPKGI